MPRLEQFCRRILSIVAAGLVVVIVSAAPVSAQPEPQSVYLVFFDFEVSGLTSAASDVVALAAKSATQTGAQIIYVVGHADGAEHHPERLSFKRARSVRDELLRLGLPGAIRVKVEGRGFSKPLVATREREPQNRIVEIYISTPPPGEDSDDAVTSNVSAARPEQTADAPGTVSSTPPADGFYLVLEDGSSDADAVTLPGAAPHSTLRLGRAPLVPGNSIANATEAPDSVGRATVEIELTQSGGALMAAATSKNLGRQLAIVIGGAVIAVSTIQAPIAGGRLQISGGWTQAEAETLASRLQALHDP